MNKKAKEWLKDKWHWLQTFNAPPTITINANRLIFDAVDGNVIEVNGRMNLNINGNLVVKNLKDERGLTYTATVEGSGKIYDSNDYDDYDLGCCDYE